MVFQIELVVDVVDCCEDIEESEAEEEFGVPIPPVLLLPLSPEMMAASLKSAQAEKINIAAWNCSHVERAPLCSIRLSHWRKRLRDFFLYCSV